ncbi:lysine histidine transporter 1-like [Chlorella sorokiniana]|uniref:Lysine histidine transporter 1-like n=1 Tax=Chlorella sorokiniana TaxID=3076 RepID=A0A2P6THC2_CHLSO|nr:lysine histidine transporter 1-like [Chlorella sorokiniana]|eukprot:PRW33689.1 lysine histidine transporter 1-like [Chlorella sorokiniana]
MHPASPRAAVASPRVGGSGGSSKAAWWAAAGHLITAMFGAGKPFFRCILGLPYALASLGWVAGTLTLAFITASSCYSAFLLADLHILKDGRRMRTLRGLAREVLGPWGGRTILAFQFTEMLAAALVYTIAGGAALMGLVHGCYGAKGAECASFSYPTWPWAVTFGGAMIVLAQVPDFRSLTGISLIGAVAPVVYAATALASLIAGGPVEGADRTMIRKPTAFGTAMNICQGIGAMAFCYGGQTVQNEVSYSLRSPPSVIQSVRRALTVAFAIITVFYFGVAVAGFAYQGNQVAGNILLAIPYQVPAIIAQVCVLLQVGAAYNVYCMALYHALEEAIVTRGLLPRGVLSRPWLLRLAVRGAFVAFFTFLAAAIPFFNQISGLNGGLTMIPLCFVSPILMTQVYYGAHMPTWRRALDWALIGVFTGLAVVATFGSVYQIAMNADEYQLFA